MTLWRFIKKLFCKICKNDIKPIDTHVIREEQLTERDKSIDKIPDDELTCPKCSMVPEIVEMHSDNGKLFLYCNNHEDYRKPVTEYLNKLVNSSTTYLNMKCSVCNRKPNGRNTKMQFCVKCRIPICKKCSELKHMEHMEHLIPIGAKNNTCRKHAKEKAEFYCLDCEEIICIDDKSHEDHNRIETDTLQEEANKYRAIISNKNQKLLSMIKFYNLVINVGNEDVKKQVANAVKKENERDEFDVDLAIYHLEKKEIIQVDIGE